MGPEERSLAKVAIKIAEMETEEDIKSHTENKEKGGLATSARYKDVN